MKKLMCIILCALLLIGLVPIIATAADTPTASITAVSGTVRVKRGNSEKDISAFIGMKIKKDDTITTGAKGAITIDIGDDKVIKAAANSSFTVTALKDRSGTAQVGFTLIYGTVYNEVSKVQAADDNYTVQAGNTIMGVRGTKFTVYYFVEDGVAKYRIVTVEGTVYTRTLEPKTMDDNNNILDIKDGFDIAKGENGGTDLPPTVMELEELSRSELEFILDDENAPDELKNTIQDILDNLPPADDDEEPNNKVVYEDKKETDTSGLGGGSSPTTTNYGAQLSGILNGMAPGGGTYTLSSSDFGGNGTNPVLQDNIAINIALFNTSNKIEIIVPTTMNLTIAAGASIMQTGVAGSPAAEYTQLTISGGTLTIDGSVRIPQITNNGTIDNRSNNSITPIAGDAAAIVNGPTGVINNTGTIDVGTGMAIINNGMITNESSGTIKFANGAIRFANQATGAGTGVDNRGTITIGTGVEFSNYSSTLTNSGTITLASGAQLNNQNGATLTNSGTITLTTATFDNSEGSGSSPVTLTNTGGTINLYSSSTLDIAEAILNHNGGNINITGGSKMAIVNASSVVILQGAINISGSDASDGSRFMATDGSVTLGGSPTITITGAAANAHSPFAEFHVPVTVNAGCTMTFDLRSAAGPVLVYTQTGFMFYGGLGSTITFNNVGPLVDVLGGAYVYNYSATGNFYNGDSPPYRMNSPIWQLAANSTRTFNWDDNAGGSSVSGYMISEAINPTPTPTMP